MTEIKSICIRLETPILEAMKIIEFNSAKIALVVNEQNQLVGTVTDGDVRRGLIRSIAIQSPVSLIMNQKPTVMNIEASAESLQKIMLQKKISQIPLVDSNHKIISIFLSNELKNTVDKKNTIVLMAGGLGSRLGSLTADCPKPMLKVGDKPILEIVLENLKEHGFKNFSIAVNFKAEVIEDYFGDGSKMGIEIEYVREQQRLGTAGALSLLKPQNDLPMIVMNGDVITKVNFSEFLENHKKNKYIASMCVRKYDLQVPFGVVHVEGQLIKNIEEKPTQSFFVNAGIYALNQEALNLIPTNTYYDMPTLFNELLKNSKNKSGVFPIHEYWMDVGRKDDFNQAQTDFKKVF
jgi:dTDP-glucose pyrophosphorylase